MPPPMRTLLTPVAIPADLPPVRLVATHHHRHQFVRINAAIKRIFNLRGGHVIDVLIEVFKIGQRQLVKTNHGKVIQNLAIAVEAQREAAGDVLLGSYQFAFGDATLHEFVQCLLDDFHGFSRLLTLGLQANLERTEVGHGHEIAIHAVDQAAFLTHFFGQARDKTTAAQDVIADIQRKVIRVAALDARVAQQNMRLRSRMLDAFIHRTLWECHRRQGWLGFHRRQLGRQAFGNLAGFFARHVAYHGNHRAFGTIVLLIKRLQVVALQRTYGLRFASIIQRIRVIAVQGFHEGLVGDALGLGGCFLQTGNGAGFFTLQGCLWEVRLLQHLAKNIQCLLTLARLAQGAQLESSTIGIQLADGTVLGDPANVKLRIDASYAKLGADGGL